MTVFCFYRIQLRSVTSSGDIHLAMPTLHKGRSKANQQVSLSLTYSFIVDPSYISNRVCFVLSSGSKFCPAHQLDSSHEIKFYVSQIMFININLINSAVEKRNICQYILWFHQLIGKKNDQSLVSDAKRKIPALGTCTALFPSCPMCPLALIFLSTSESNAASVCLILTGQCMASGDIIFRISFIKCSPPNGTCKTIS